MSTPNAVFHTLCGAQKPSELLCGWRGWAGDRGSHPDRSERAERKTQPQRVVWVSRPWGVRGRLGWVEQMPGARCSESEPEPRWVRKHITALASSAALVLT